MEDTMESVVRVTLAGLGGSIMGLSQQRRLESMRVVTGAAATAAARRKRSPSAQLANLPWTWAISCIVFVSIIEASRLTSPSSRIYDLVMDQQQQQQQQQDKERGATKTKPAIPPAVFTVADYTIGGMVGGIASSLGRNTHLRKQLPSAMLQGSRRFFGVGPGITLGFVAGVLQAATDTGVSYFEQRQ